MAKTYILRRTQWVPQPLEAAFEFFGRPANLEEITPPWLHFHIAQAPAQLGAGSLIRYRLRIHKIPVRWTTEISQWNPPRSFVDVQLAGPYALWRHTHTFVAEREGTTIEDRVEYRLPLGALGLMVHSMLVRRDLRRIFDYREEKIRKLLGG